MVLFFTILSILTAIVSFILGLLVLLRNPIRNQNFTFFVFTWFITIWSMLSYAFFVNQSNFALYKVVYATGGVCLLTTAPWVLYYLKEKPNSFLVGLFYAMAAFLFSVPFWDQTAITNFVNHGNRTYTFNVGISYDIYTSAVFLTVIFLFYELIRHLIKAKSSRRYQILFILVGLFIYFSAELLFGVILPILNITPSAPLDDLGAISFVCFSAYTFLRIEKETPQTSF
jgi:hypothetical protein